MPGYLEIAEAVDLCMCYQIGREKFNPAVRRKRVFNADYVLQLVQEPPVNFCELINSFYRHSLIEGFGDREYSHIGWLGKLLLQIVENEVAVARKPMHSL